MSTFACLVNVDAVRYFALRCVALRRRIRRERHLTEHLFFQCNIVIFIHVSNFLEVNNIAKLPGFPRVIIKSKLLPFNMCTLTV